MVEVQLCSTLAQGFAKFTQPKDRPKSQGPAQRRLFVIGVELEVKHEMHAAIPEGLGA